MRDRGDRGLGPEAGRRLGRNVAAHRLRAGLSRAEVAHRALVSAAWLKTVEEGRAGAGLDAWIRLAGALDATLDDLLEGVTWVPTPGERQGGGGYVLD